MLTPSEARAVGEAMWDHTDTQFVREPAIKRVACAVVRATRAAAGDAANIDADDAVESAYVPSRVSIETVMESL